MSDMIHGGAEAVPPVGFHGARDAAEREPGASPCTGIECDAPEGASAAPGKLTSTVLSAGASLAEGRARSWVHVDDGDHKG
jgi:hypothetical protein